MMDSMPMKHTHPFTLTTDPRLRPMLASLLLAAALLTGHPGVERSLAQNRQQPAAERTTHTVSQGETLFSLSMKYGVGVEDIKRWNNLEDNLISVNQRLLVSPPSGAAPDVAVKQITSDPQAVRETYTVRSGDTLFGIAREKGVSVADIKRLNNLRSDVLSIGQVLVLQAKSSIPSVSTDDADRFPQGIFREYRVNRGETIEEILERYRMDLQEFAVLNPGLNPSAVREGELLTLLVPPTRFFENPYRRQRSTGVEDLTVMTTYTASEELRPTTSGELYNPESFTAAHATLPIGTILYVENPESGLGTVVKINDRFNGPGLKLSLVVVDFLELQPAETDARDGKPSYLASVSALEQGL
jgi:LysM repeat protein